MRVKLYFISTLCLRIRLIFIAYAVVSFIDYAIRRTGVTIDGDGGRVEINLAAISTDSGIARVSTWAT